MNKVGCAAMVAATAALAAFSAQGITITKGSPYTRSARGGLSGITYAGGSSYYIVQDNGDGRGLYSATINLSSDGKSITGYSLSASPVVPSGTSDTEGVAYDPASGNVWIAEEEGKTIKEYNPQAGTEIQSLTIPAVLKRINGNFGFESLTISGDGLTLWTCNDDSQTLR